MKLSFFMPVAALALLAGACSRHDSVATAPATARPPVPARIVTLRTENVPVVVEVSGTVRPVQRAQLAAKVMGTIDELPVILGQRVQRGDALVKISAAETGARVVQARSQLSAAARDLERERGLLGKGASTADTVKGLEDRHAAATAMLREAEAMLGYATLRAPFDGVVARKFVHEGDLAAPGSPLVELEGTTSGFEVEAAVPDSLAAALAPETSIQVEIPALGTVAAGKVAEISSAADSRARTVAIKVALPGQPGLRSGQFVRIQIPSTPVPGLFVPSSAVTVAGQMERVFVAADDNRAVLRLVKTGARREDRIEILSGLDAGERVVVAPAVGLREGQRLEPRP